MKKNQPISDQTARPVLFLPGWYPTPVDPQDGIFIRKHALAVSTFKPVVVLCPLPTSVGVFQFVKEDGRLIEYHPKYRHCNIPFIGGTVNFLRYTKATFKGLRAIFRNHAPDMVHVHVLTRNAIGALWLLATKGLPFIVTEHWTGYLSGHYERLSIARRVFMRFSSTRASVFTVVSPALRKALKQFKFHSDIRIIPNVVDFHSPHFVTGRSDVQDRAGARIRILNVSDLYDFKKNVSGLLRACSKLICEGYDLELQIIGDGPDRKILEDLSRELPGLKGRLHFSGRLPNVEVLKAMISADFYVCPSHTETFSVTTAEALAAGKPVVCTACGGPEFFVDNDCGIVVPKNDQRALEDAMRKMCRNFKSYNRETLRAVTTKFDSVTVGSQFATVYKEILSSRS